jgi:hypothetical protein
MKASLQTRVLALVGAGVFLAVALLSLLSRSSLLLLDREVVHDHERLAASLARELSRAVGHDMRLLSGPAGRRRPTCSRASVTFAATGGSRPRRSSWTMPARLSRASRPTSAWTCGRTGSLI